MVNRCKCGCGTIIPDKDKKGRKRSFVVGHTNFLREYKPLSQETIQKILTTKKKRYPHGLSSWNKGLTKYTSPLINEISLKISKKLANKNNPNMKNIHIREIDENLAYVLGCLCGDASILASKSKYGRINCGSVRLSCKDKDFAIAFKNYLNKYFKDSFFWYNLNTHVYYTGITSTSLIREIISRWGYFKVKTWQVPLEIKNSKNSIKASFLKGLFDSDGSVSKKGYIRIQKINPNLKQIHELLLSLDIKNSYRRENRLTIAGNFVYSINIFCLEDRKKFGEVIGFEIKRKYSRLKDSL